MSATGDLAGLGCLVAGDDGPLAAALRAGLEAAGARVATAPPATSRDQAEHDVAAVAAGVGELRALVTISPAIAGIAGPVQPSAASAASDRRTSPSATASAELGELAPAVFDATQEAIFRSPFLHTQAALPRLRASRAGRLVYVTSTLATTALPFTAHVAAAERAVVALMRTAALEGGPEVTANAVVAGPMRGGTLLAARARALGVGAEAAAERVAAEMPARRLTEPRDVAECVTWLLRPASDHVSGRVLTAAGGAELHG